MTIQEIIQRLKNGNKEEIKTAKGELEKIWHANAGNRKLFTPFLSEIENFDSIKNIRNRVAFITALRWPFLSLGHTHFSLCKDFVLRILQDESGQLRQAMIHSANRLIPIFPLFSFRFENLPKRERRVIEKSRLRFFELVEEVEDLIGRHYRPEFERCKYISSLPPSVYKTLQRFLSNLLRSEALENLYLEYRYEKDKQGLGGRDLPGMKLIQREEEWDYYYDAMEYLNMRDTRMARMLLQKAIEIDQDFVAGYVGITAVARTEGDSEKEEEYTNLAYAKTRKHFPKWPEEMSWGVIENRQYLRAICDKAILYQEESDFQEAERLYRLLLRLNPNDNQGIRYLIAGMFAGLDPGDVDALIDEGNELQNWDKLERLVIEQNAKHRFWEK